MNEMKLIGMNVSNPEVFKGWNESQFINAFEMLDNYKIIPQPARLEALKSDWKQIEATFPKKTKKTEIEGE